MAFASPEYWEAYYKTPERTNHIDWLCQYSTLRKIVLKYLNNWEPPLPAILLLGTGLSTFAEELYDNGFSPIVVLDCASVPAAEHRQRSAAPPRSGLTVVQGDVADPRWPELDERGLRFGIVLDKGLIDCLLSGPDGIDRATAAISGVWSRMSTPGVWISVSHSPPADRRDLYCMSTAAAAGATSVYWHDVQVKRVQLPPLEDSAASAVPGPELVEDYGEPGPSGAGGQGGKPAQQQQQRQQQQQQSSDRQQARAEGGGEEAAAGGETEMEGFSDDVAYIYLLTK